MTVYVDDMAARHGRMIMFHMVADTDHELHAMAERLGIARRWFQGDHYDVSKGAREIAIQNGALSITFRQLGCMVANRRDTGSLGDPMTAVALRRQLRAEARHAQSLPL